MANPFRAETIAFSRRPILNLLGLPRAPAFLVFLRQLYFSGAQSFVVVCLSAILFGAGFILAFKSVFSTSISFAALELLGVVTVRSLSVLIPALIFCARSVSAITSELCLMSITGEVKTLRFLSVSPWTYLLLPRLVAASFSMAFLTIYFMLASLVSGAIVAGDSFGLAQIIIVFDAVRPVEVCSAIFRSAFIGALLVAWIFRFEVTGIASFPDVSRTTSSAILHALLLLLVSEAIYQALIFPLL